MAKQTEEKQRDLDILTQLGENPDATQATLANQLGVAVGTINWHVKRLVEKGYLKIQRCERRKLKYIVTPEGLAMRSRLTVDYIQSSLEMYRLIRKRMNAVLEELEERKTTQIILLGDGDVADICRLTCLERGIKVVAQDHAAANVPVVEICAYKLFIREPESRVESESK